MDYVKLRIDKNFCRSKLRFLHEAILFVSSLTLLAPAAADISFDTHHIQAGFVVRQPVLAPKLDSSDQPYVLLQGDDAEYRQWIAIYRFHEAQFEEVYKFEVPPALLYFDTGSFNCVSGMECIEALYFLSSDGLVTWDMIHGEFRAVTEISSIYHRERRGSLRYQDFVRDVENDGLDDLIVPDRHGYRIRRQGIEGEPAEDYLLPDSVRMRLSDEGASYTGRSIYATDLNFDGYKDLFFLRDQRLHGFLQRVDGSFSTEVTYIEIPLEFISEAQEEVLEENWGEVDQSDLVYKQIAAIEDFNGDGLLDIATDATVNEGLFDKHSQFELHLGTRQDNWLSYSSAPDTVVRSKGIQLVVEPLDLDDDGRKDLVAATVRISLMKIIRALFSGGIKVNFLFYRMREDSTYPLNPDYKTSAKMEFDLGTGFVSVPALVVADFDGDGIKDLMVQSGTDKLAYHQGLRSHDLFASKAQTVRLDLPGNGELVQAEDVDGDGRSDLIIRYDRSDSEEQSAENTAQANKGQSIKIIITKFDRQDQS